MEIGTMPVSPSQTHNQEPQGRQAPGSWPADDPHAGSAARYREADEAEREVIEKQAELADMRQVLERMRASKPNARAQSREGGDEAEEEEEEDEKIKMQRKEVEKLAFEVEQLASGVDFLRLQADEDFARELAAEEHRELQQSGL